MKKFFVLSFAALAASVVASAGTLTQVCTPYPAQFPGGNTNTPQSVTCPGLASSPSIVGLTSVTLNYAVDFQFASVVPSSVSVTFTPNVAGAVFNPTSLVINNSTASGATPPAGSGSVQTGSASAISGVTLANFASSFTVSEAAALTGGTIATSSGAVTVTYNYVDATPEPATLSLIGLSLAGLGLAARRRK